MRGIFIGRFQPLHLGHVKAITWILENVDELIIGIGSSNVALSFKNPFTVGERIEMIFKTLRNMRILDRIYICTIPDTYGEHSLWHAYVKHCCPDFQVAYTNDEFTKVCLEYGGYRVENIPFFDREKYNSTRVRLAMAKELEEWKFLVPESVVEIIERIRGVERVKRLAIIEKVI